MSTESNALTFIMPKPFEQGLKAVRRALTEGDLQIQYEMDISGRLERELGIGLGPCRVLCVDHPFSTLEAMIADPSAGVLLPLHVVVSGLDAGTVIHILNPENVHGSSLFLGAKVPISRLLGRLMQNLGMVAMRQGPLN
jgi:uncharacterized protein (DUF302 family)